MPRVNPARSSGAEPRPLRELLAAAGLGGATVSEAVVRGISTDSRAVRAGDLFVALAGTARDGHDFLDDAIAAGAVAVVVEGHRRRKLPVPVVAVADARRCLARLAAAWHQSPLESLPLVGITGTLGKTSVLTILEAILLRGGIRAATIGSLGVRIAGEQEETGYTAPDPLTLHAALSRIGRSGARLAAMEVTTHALSQERVHGVNYSLGIFTNLVPLEHLDYHGSFRNYVEAKTRFFEHLQAGAPLVYSSDDRAVRRLARGHDVQPVGVGRTRSARVLYEVEEMDAAGTTFVLRCSQELPLLEGGRLPSFEFRTRMRLLGRSNVTNAALAATAALVAGATCEAAQAALAELAPARRRMEVLRSEPFLVLDDTTGHPDSVTAVFEVVERLGRARVHAAVGVRGSRGRRINRRTAEALGIWARRVPLSTLVVTCSADAADERNRVEERERDAFVEALDAAGVSYQLRERLDEAIELLVRAATPGDLVLLLGAQGMDAAAAVLERQLLG